MLYTKDVKEKIMSKIDLNTNKTLLLYTKDVKEKIMSKIDIIIATFSNVYKLSKRR